jgi:hypothetical protein
MNKTAEQILQRRMHGLYLSRWCGNLLQLSHELLGLHCWFHRNVAFSALIRGAPLSGWKTALTKTWLYRGTLHGVVYEDLPQLLALHADETSYAWLGLNDMQIEDMIDRVTALMDDGVYSRAEMRRIFLHDMDEEILKRVFSPWGGIFVPMARQGRVAFRSMTSRDFDLIDAEPTQTFDEVLSELLHRYFAAYGPATLEDAAWFFGLQGDKKQRLSALNLDSYGRLIYNGSDYYYVDDQPNMGDIPELTLLSGFDPLIVSYVERSVVLPLEYKKAVILKSGICLPTIAINGVVAGVWNINKNEPVVEFFKEQPKRMKDAALDLVENIRWQTSGIV